MLSACKRKRVKPQRVAQIARRLSQPQRGKPAIITATFQSGSFHSGVGHA